MESGIRKTCTDSIHLSDVTVRYGRKTALNHVNLDLDLSGKVGKVIGLFGPNGAGKSTFMRLLCGFNSRFDGQISAPEPDMVSFMPDRPYFYDSLLIRDAISAFSNRYCDFDSGKAHAMCHKLELDESAPMSSLSKGMNEQVHMIMTFSRHCPLYVLDEPLAAVDPYTRDEILDTLVAETKRGATVMLSTHIIAEVERIFTHVVMINDGKVLANSDVTTFRNESGSLEQAFKDKMKEARHA